MFKILSVLLLTSFLACSQPTPKLIASIPVPVDHFANMNGCFLLYNLKTNTFDKMLGDEAYCRVRLPACSTFKVPLAVMAFDSKVLKDENQVLKWDHKPKLMPAWNQDQNAKSWIKESVVWVSQRLTPKIGMKHLKKYLHDFHYGNEDMSAGIKQAWLVRPDSNKAALALTPYEQIDFMKLLWTGKLKASARAIKLTQEITYLETSPAGFQLSGKTGSSFYDQDKKQRLGWFVAHIQKGDKEYLAVTRFSDLGPVEGGAYGGMKAKQITKDILTEQNLW